MGSVTFERAGRGLQIQPTGFLLSGHLPPDRNPDGTWRALSQTDTFGVRSLLREFVSGDSDCRKLRELIGGIGSMALARLSNEQLIDSVAEMVIARRLLVLEKVHDADPSGQRQVMRAATVKYTPSERASTPTQLKHQPSLADAPPAHEPPPAVEESFVVNVDHDVQAGVLKAAAASGVPFCELCEKAKQAKAALHAPLATES